MVIKNLVLEQLKNRNEISTHRNDWESQNQFEGKDIIIQSKYYQEFLILERFTQSRKWSRGSVPAIMHEEKN